MSTADDLVSIIEKISKQDRRKVEDLVKDKYEEFSGMITMEAAAHLVARDLGVELPKNGTQSLQVKNMMPGMRGVSLIARIFKVSPINEFQKKSGEKGRVVNLFLSDGTGYTRVPLWNDQVKMVEEDLVKVGDVVQIFNAMTKENVYGETEIMLGKFGGLKTVEDNGAVPSLESVDKSYVKEKERRLRISELVPGKHEIKATVVQVFRGKFIFESDSGDKGLVASCIADDGTGDIRVVMFRETVEEVTGLKVSDMDPLDPEARLEKMKRTMMGQELVFSGTVKRNSFFNSLEFVADSVKGLNASEESKRLAEELEAKIGA